MQIKLEYYILGLLILDSQTGYDVKKHLDTEGRFERRRAPLSQIYNTLKRMSEDELVTFEEEQRDGKPDIKLYSITPAGKKLLIDFLNSPIEPPFRHIESGIFFYIRYAFLVEPKVIITHIQDELAFRREQIRTFRHRDRTIHSAALSAAEQAYVQAINDKLHNFGAARMDMYVVHLEKMLTFFEARSTKVLAAAVA